MLSTHSLTPSVPCHKRVEFAPALCALFSMERFDMDIIRRMLCASVITLGAIEMSPGVSAEDLRLDEPDSGRFTRQPDSSARQRDGAQPDPSRSASDDIGDLEARRAAIDRRTGSGSSLSVSGQVNTEVLHAK